MGYFWTGFYNQRVSDEPICYTRTSFSNPDDSACARGFVQTAAGGQVAANYNLVNRLLDEIQAAFDSLALPPVIIVQGGLEDDDDDAVPVPVPSSGTTITNTQTTITNTITNTGTTITNTIYDDNDSSSASAVVLSLALAGFAVLLN